MIWRSEGGAEDNQSALPMAVMATAHVALKPIVVVGKKMNRGFITIENKEPGLLN